jgi:uncharacterized membrane protein YadS
VLVVLRSAGVLPHAVIDLASESSKWCVITAIAALGMKISFKSLFAVGWRPISLMVIETLWIGGLVLGLVCFA